MSNLEKVRGGHLIHMREITPPMLKGPQCFLLSSYGW